MIKPVTVLECAEYLDVFYSSTLKIVNSKSSCGARNWKPQRPFFTLHFPLFWHWLAKKPCGYSSVSFLNEEQRTVEDALEDKTPEYRGAVVEMLVYTEILICTETLRFRSNLSHICNASRVQRRNFILRFVQDCTPRFRHF